jgi:L-fuconolactonase
MLIDTHQHYWRYNERDFGWIEESMASTRRDFMPSDARPLLKAAGVSGAVVVQARQSLEETDWLLELADQNDFIHGVVGWLPITPAELKPLMGKYSVDAQRKLVGVRHVIQAEPDGFLEGTDFNAGIELIGGMGVTFDLVVVARQLPQVVEFVGKHPGVRFVLDHLGKPNNQLRQMEPWMGQMRALAAHENVYCKMSGGICEADPAWTAESLDPYFDAALSCFGPRRLLFGSNWPVIHCAGGYHLWAQTVQSWARCKMGDGADELFRQATMEAYPRLTPG